MATDLPPTIQLATDTIARFSEKVAAAGISKRTGWRLAKAGRINLVRIGRTVFVRESEWQAFIASLPAYAPEAPRWNRDHFQKKITSDL